MNLNSNPEAEKTLATLETLGLLKGKEMDAIQDLGNERSRFSEVIDLAESIHLHIKVDDTNQLPINAFFDNGARLDHQKEGFVKYRFPGGINAIFSHIKVSQEELVENESNRRPRPFLDHIGIDLRNETDAVRAAFDSLPSVAESNAFAIASQGGPERPVYCCHVEVAEKHWLYPKENSGDPGIPLEFAYGALKVNPESSGCDLRPADPNRLDPASIPDCCGSSSSGEESPCLPGTSSSYYQSSDLKRFQEIGRSDPAMADTFFSYYTQVLAENHLSRREKCLIGLAVAHALKCPYCIDSLGNACLEAGLSEKEMMEAVHVAAALAAGVTLVHSTQLLRHLDARVRS